MTNEIIASSTFMNGVSALALHVQSYSFHDCVGVGRARDQESDNKNAELCAGQFDKFEKVTTDVVQEKGSG